MLNFIVNPKSFQGSKEKKEKFWREAEERLKKAGAEYAVYYSDEKGGCGTLARKLTEAGETKIIAVGGDGTLNEVICNLADPSVVELGLIPAGTGNDFAVSAKIPKGLAALDLILEGEAKYTDYIECGNGIRSMNIAGMGIDVDITERVIRRKRGGNKSKYFHGLLSSLAHYKGLTLEITANGVTEKRHVLIVVACNGSQFGGGIPICPVAVIDDGKLDLLVVDCPSRLGIPLKLIKLMRGNILKDKIAHHVLCDSARIVPETPQSIEVDGELFSTDALDAKIVSGKLKMFRG